MDQRRTKRRAATVHPGITGRAESDGRRRLIGLGALTIPPCPDVREPTPQVPMVRWMVMSTLTRRSVAAAAAAVAALAVGLPSASGAPEADGNGYLDSTARCAAPNTVVVFGGTDTSRVAICRSPDGKYEYRGVRLSDGAKLVVPAEASTDGAFVAEGGGIGYLVTAKSLVVSEGNKVIREEPMVDFHGPAAPAPETSTPTSTTPLPPPLPAEQGHGG
jgi:hypothetical protein